MVCPQWSSNRTFLLAAVAGTEITAEIGAWRVRWGAFLPPHGNGSRGECSPFYKETAPEVDGKT